MAPTPGTLRRSQRTAARKAEAPVEEEQPAEDVSAAKRTTRSTKSKMTLALDQEEEVVAAASKEEEKVQQEEPKGERLSLSLINLFLLFDFSGQRLMLVSLSCSRRL